MTPLQMAVNDTIDFIEGLATLRGVEWGIVATFTGIAFLGGVIPTLILVSVGPLAALISYVIVTLLTIFIISFIDRS